MKKQVKLFLDSGAYSALTQNAVIDIDQYIAFIKEHEDLISIYANLDAIGDPEKTLANQKYMEAKGLSPLPCFHYGEDEKYLKHYLKNYKYMALGGMVPIANSPLTVWLDRIFADFICDKSGMPTIKVHGFGLTSLPLLLRYPWYSVDSTSWVMTSRMGSIYVPKYKNGKWLYDENPLKIIMSAKSPAKKEAGKHISTLAKAELDIINKYLQSKNYSIGRSDFKEESEKYTLKENERWAGKPINGKREVEIVVEPGLCNEYKLRDEVNIIFFMDLEKSIQQWPWSFKCESTIKGFGI